ncbi:hypothetical protein REC12_17900 [Desulfosporosinus sp. PR]|uniref:hypothetical protein n=1 Tax=Candidatus Desulfosporosinus nitrosoreducens TaxID=3401928 RepID=UPI0027ED53E8|nr:hypothetical protein [Desulfosporosinus sp. PR]MDQ7095466.1 hypothetical protein [Desulfosporosinus sp. PR]
MVIAITLISRIVTDTRNRANKLMRIFTEYGAGQLASSNSDLNPNLNCSQAVEELKDSPEKELTAPQPGWRLVMPILKNWMAKSNITLTEFFAEERPPA